MKLKNILLAFSVSALSVAVFAPGVSHAADGEKVFRKCMACHAVQPGQHRVGPSLAGVVDRKAGTAEGYNRYKGLKDADWVWTEDLIFAYLEDPTEFTKARNGERSAMAFKLKDEGERRAVIEYLKKHSGG